MVLALEEACDIIFPPKSDHFQGTFWGLCRMLTDINDFDDVKDLSQKGDNKNVDLLVGDIYGGDYQDFGLKADVIASSFGKIATTQEDSSYPPK